MNPSSDTAGNLTRGTPFIRQSNTSADDLDVGKIGLIVVVLALFTTAPATA